PRLTAHGPLLSQRPAGVHRIPQDAEGVRALPGPFGDRPSDDPRLPGVPSRARRRARDRVAQAGVAPVVLPPPGARGEAVAESRRPGRDAEAREADSPPDDRG